MRPLLATALLAVTTALVPVGASSGAAAATCHGVRATKVGTPKANMLGTPGRDVIVSNGARQVRTNGGDDLVCITGKARYTKVAGDDGDETVYVETTTTDVSFLGRLGSDTFVGGPNGDSVSLRLDGDDRVSTGAGADNVDFDHAPHRGRLKVSLGSGDDYFSAFAGEIKGMVDGGTDTDDYVVSHRSKGAWVLDNRRGRATNDGRTRLRWDGFESFDLTFFDVPTLRFLGGDGPEVVTQQESGGRRPTTTYSMGAGDDSVSVSSRDHGSVDGGIVTDTLRFGVNSPQGLVSLVADLAAHTAVVDYATGTDATWTLGGLERLATSGFPTVTLRGDDADNVLTGGAGNDTLVGGGGTDTVDGGAGTDSCDAEVETGCELP